jgi:YesN/AraC family two-component response regulator
VEAVAVVSEPLKLLFVDDEPSMLVAIRRVLAKSPFVVHTANDAEEALGKLRAEPIDVLIADVDMPGMNGLELVERARREFPSTLRALLTATPSQDRVLRAINDGEVCRFFVKPFDAAAFLDAMASLAGRIERDRRARAEDATAERRSALVRWAQERYSSLLIVERDDEDAVVIDVLRAREGYEALRARRARDDDERGPDSVPAIADAAGGTSEKR